MTSRLIDGRDLLPPEPMTLVLAALVDLAVGETLTVLLYREPFPLYEALRREGCTWRCRLEPDGTYVIEVSR